MHDIRKDKSSIQAHGFITNPEVVVPDCLPISSGTTQASNLLPLLLPLPSTLIIVPSAEPNDNPVPLSPLAPD